MAVKRKPLQGALNILSFNRHFYYFGMTLLALILVSTLWIPWPAFPLFLILGMFLYGLIMPLVVSAYVYDLSGYYTFQWINNIFPDRESSSILVNISAGFDESSYDLHRLFPNSEIRAFDFYNPEQHTEAAIRRARKVSMLYPGTQSVSTDRLPLPDNSADYVFLLSTAHEIRDFEEKVRFLKECRRILRPDGHLVMVEHLRDFPNFVAFTVGFTHFFSKAVWKKAFRQSGFSVMTEKKFTPFMSIFVMPKQA